MTEIAVKFPKHISKNRLINLICSLMLSKGILELQTLHLNFYLQLIQWSAKISSIRVNKFQKLLQKHHALAYIKSFLQNKKNPLNSSYIVLFSLHKSNRLRMKSNLNERLDVVI